MAMTLKDAWLYAAQWGSFMHSGDPGACLYGFDEDFRVQTEQHRADCLEQMTKNRHSVEAKPGDYDADELAQIDFLIERLKTAKLEGDPGALDDADDFTRGYVEALIWTDNASNAEDGRTFEAQCEGGDNEGSFPASATAEDLSPDAVARIKAHCAAFQADPAYKAFEAWRDDDDSPDTTPASDEQAGRDFWLTRNGHGTGFWDRPANYYGPHQDALAKLARKFGEVWTYFGDDGRIHL